MPDVGKNTTQGINLELDKYVIDGSKAGIVKVFDSKGWYALPMDGGLVQWHFGQRWHAERGDGKGVSAVVSVCQGRDIYESGKGMGYMEWHGVFRLPVMSDFKGATVCRVCWEFWKEKVDGIT